MRGNGCIKLILASLYTFMGPALYEYSSNFLTIVYTPNSREMTRDSQTTGVSAGVFSLIMSGDDHSQAAKVQ